MALIGDSLVLLTALLPMAHGFTTGNCRYNDERCTPNVLASTTRGTPAAHAATTARFSLVSNSCHSSSSARTSASARSLSSPTRHLPTSTRTAHPAATEVLQVCACEARQRQRLGRRDAVSKSDTLDHCGRTSRGAARSGKLPQLEQHIRIETININSR